MTEHRLDLAEVTGWIVYRLYDAQDTLLYVGHRTASVFWPRVHHIVFEHADTRRTMEDLEHQLIRTHQPPYNTVGLGPYQ